MPRFWPRGTSGSNGVISAGPASRAPTRVAPRRRTACRLSRIMMEVSPGGLAVKSQLVSNIAVAQLLVCFLSSLVRPDSFVVAPLVALYSVRERDRRALMLYMILVVAGVLMDFIYLVAGGVGWLGVTFAIVQLGLKLAVRFTIAKPPPRLKPRPESRSESPAVVPTAERPT